MSEQIYQSIQKGTASGRGVSYWQVASSCGEKRHLSDLHQKLVTENELYVEQKRQGTYYHALKDFWYKGQIPDGMVLDVGPVQDVEWAEALRLFNWHREQFPRSYWGEVVASEFRFPVSEDHRSRIAAFFGHAEVTGAADAVVMLSAEDVHRLELDRGVTLRGPGLYLLDHKTSGARKSVEQGQAEYVESIQAKAYPVLWNLIGGESCKGIIFDVLVKHKELRRHDLHAKSLSSVQTFFAPYSPENDAIVKTAINFAKRKRDARERDPYACWDDKRECIFKKQGLCPGYTHE